jgi:hypothetical protein
MLHNDPQSLMNGMVKKNNELSLKIDELTELSESMAQAERDFNVAYAKKLLELKASGNAITTAKDLAKGDSNVAELLFKFRVAEAVHSACKKRIDALGTGIDTYRSLLSFKKQEYGQTA